MDFCERKLKPKQQINEDNAIVNAYKIKGIMFSGIEKCIFKIIRKTRTNKEFFVKSLKKILNY